MKNPITYLILLSVILLGTTLIAYRAYKHEKENAVTWQNNAIALVEDIATYRINDSLNAVKVQGLNLEINDLKKLNSNLYSDIEVLKVKNRNLSGIIQSITTTTGSNSDTIYVPIKTDTIGNRIANLSYKDSYFSLTTKLQVEPEKVAILPESLRYTYTDTLTFATSIKYKRFWYTFCL